jgi:hypothetical protein
MFASDLADTINGMDPRSFALSKVETVHFFVVRNELIVGLANKFEALAACRIRCVPRTHNAAAR